MTSEQTAPDALKPCPFCGGQPNIYPADPEREGDAWTSIECANCVTAPPFTQSMARVTHYADSGHFEAAVEAWNTRQAEADKAELVEALAAAILEHDAGGITLSTAKQMRQALAKHGGRDE